MNINAIRNSNPIQGVTRPAAAKSTAAPAAARPDKLELSGLSQLMKTLKSNGIRTEKVAAIRAQIESGTYEDDHKLNAAVDRLLDEVAS